MIMSMNKQYWVYMLASSKDGAIYIGVTSDIIKRVYQHKNSIIKGHTSKYNIKRLVYFVEFSDPENAIRYEKRLKKYNRQWKINLIEQVNPEWKDLWDEIAK